jgi:hypothetical protein
VVQFLFEVKHSSFLPSVEIDCGAFRSLAFEEHRRYFTGILLLRWATAVAQWLRYCATNRKVAGSIPDGVIGIFH